MDPGKIIEFAGNRPRACGALHEPLKRSAILQESAPQASSSAPPPGKHPTSLQSAPQASSALHRLPRQRPERARDGLPLRGGEGGRPRARNSPGQRASNFRNRPRARNWPWPESQQFQKVKDSKIQQFKISKIQKFKNSKIQRFKKSKIQKFKGSKIQKSGTFKNQISKKSIV